MDLKLSCGITGSTNKRNQKRNETIVNNYSAQCRPKILAQYSEFSPTSRSGRLNPSKHAVLRCPTSSKLGKCSLQLQRVQVVLILQANIMQRCAFLSGTDPSMPSKALIQPNLNKLNIDRLLQVTGGSFDPSKTLHRLRIAIEAGRARAVPPARRNRPPRRVPGRR